jgi:CheY-like chemotaxis protein
MPWFFMPSAHVVASFDAGTPIDAPNNTTKGAKYQIRQTADSGHALAMKPQELRMFEETVVGEMENGCSFSIVIVDDNPGSLEYLSNALAVTGMKIYTAQNAEQGLNLIYLHRPQIVLSDLVMPTLSGIDVLQRVREFDPNIRVVIMTANDPGRVAAKTIQDAGTDYLKKPIALSLLRKYIRQLIQNPKS